MNKIIKNTFIIIIFSIFGFLIWVFTNIYICKFFEKISICQKNQAWDEKFLNFFIIWWVLLSYIILFFIYKKQKP